MQDFDEIYSKYFLEVYRFVLTLCQNPDTAEEITQETFFKALKSIDNFKSQCEIGTWLCKIAKNTFYSQVKKQSGDIDYPLEIIVSDSDLEKQFCDKQTVDNIYKILHGLKEPYKEVFWLRTFGDLSFAKIGALFDKTESWARVTYYRAKIMIKEKLE